MSKKRRGRKPKCSFCGTETRRPSHVNLNEGDGCFRVEVCAACLKKNGWTPEQQVEGAP